MNMIASLPMYDWPEVRGATVALWDHVGGALREAGFDAPMQMNGSGESRDVWRSDNLLFSQTCGYPYISDLSDAVQLLWRPTYEIEGCGEGTYRSAVLARRGEAEDLLAHRGKRLAFNSKNSLSGYRCFSPMLGDVSEFFGTLVASGAHRNSALMVARGEADIAALDAVCWDFMQRFEPEIADQLAVIDWAPEFPSLPFITSLHHASEKRDAIKLAVSQGLKSSLADRRCDPLKLVGLVAASKADYDCLRDL